MERAKMMTEEEKALLLKILTKKLYVEELKRKKVVLIKELYQQCLDAEHRPQKKPRMSAASKAKTEGQTKKS